ncbi:arylsulfatase B-like [Diadema antillarum]|uniref:arylsulfatase B-like n=1 Tax=Diadema antillarum TaxID=105358 RepID=UPI003A857D7B
MASAGPSSLLFCCCLLLLNLMSRFRSSPRPHIVFVLADDLGFSDIGYHDSEIRTPNLDRLAAGGVKLENYYVQPICTPTRSQLLSGRYQIHTGMQHSIIRSAQRSCLPLEVPTLAEKLLELGYSTHMVGKWHLGFYKKDCWPTHRGFQTFFGFLGGHSDYFQHTTSEDGFIGKDLRDNEEQVADQYTGQYSTLIFTQRAEQIIRNHDASKPLFLYVPFQAVHGPLQALDHYLYPYRSVEDYHRRYYAAMVACMDEAVGNITKALKANNLWENTVLVFSTDNGGQVSAGGYNWPLRGWKGSLWEGGTRGIGFVASPLLDPSVRGSVSNELIHVSDWYPTLVQGVAGGVVNRSELDGFNQWSSIKEGSASPRHEMLYNIDPPGIPHKGSEEPIAMPPVFTKDITAALRYMDWKLLTGRQYNSSWIPVPGSGIAPINPSTPPTKKTWLFNIKDDPLEKTDLSDENPAMVNFLLDRLQFYLNSSAPVFWPPLDPEGDPALHNGSWTSWE